MRDKEVPVSFRPSGRTVYVLPGTRLSEAAGEADIVLDQPCGGEGVCRKCRVRVVAGAAAPNAAEAKAFSAAELDAGMRLACQATVAEAATVDVPESSLLPAQHKILAQGVSSVEAGGDPPVRKRYVELPPPKRGDDAPDTIRLERAIGPFRADLPLLRTISHRLREQHFRGTAVLADGRLIDFEPQNTEGECCAVAVDVGTTTLVAVLLDVATGRELAVASRLNPQTRFGDDVLSRIVHAQETAGGLDDLQAAVLRAVDEMIGELCAAAAVARERIYEIVFSGNTTMQHLLCGIDPQPLAQVPFVPTTGRGLLLPAVELGLSLECGDLSPLSRDSTSIHPRGRAYVLPVIGGFVGGDTVAGILATGLTQTGGATLLVDIGTNGEIVLWADGRLTAASTAAGPAFEGARISQGMRGSTGAIEKVVVDGRLRINVIGNVPPVGLCGSGLIDVAAELLRHGLLTPQGRLLPREQLPAGVLPDLAERVVDENVGQVSNLPNTVGQASSLPNNVRQVANLSGSSRLVGNLPHDPARVAFLLASADETGNGRPILLTQRDLRELQLATGAIRAGITILLRRAGLRPGDLQGVLIGGGFGNFIRRSNAQRIGLLPTEVQRQRIRYQGNTSLAGARLVALSRQARQAAEDLARQTEHVDLSSDRDFHATFAESMLFPEVERGS